MTQIIDALNWRYATKAYNTDKKLSEDQVNMLIESVRLTPSSYGLQTYKVIHVKDAETREKLKAVAWGQSQITDASDLFVFAVKTNVNENDVDDFMNLVAAKRNVAIESLQGYARMIKGTINSLNSDEKIVWASRQAYIGLGVLLTSAALNNIDSTPMEGFDSAAFDEILGLKDLGLKSVVICVAGYRSESDDYSNLKKVRVETENLVINK